MQWAFVDGGKKAAPAPSPLPPPPPPVHAPPLPRVYQTRVNHAAVAQQPHHCLVLSQHMTMSPPYHAPTQKAAP